MITTIMQLLKNPKIVLKAVFGLSVALLLMWSINLHKQNKMLSQRLETASNNIEAYEGMLAENQDKNNTLGLTVEDMRASNDRLLQQLDSVIADNKIKQSKLKAAATQTQTVSVTGGKGVRIDLVEVLKDTTYSDSIIYNPLTKVHYTIGRDTVNIGIELQNTQYVYTYKQKQYKNKKSFIKRLLTLDFKKVWKHKYEIINTNDLVNTSNVRVVEIIE